VDGRFQTNLPGPTTNAPKDARHWRHRAAEARQMSRALPQAEAKAAFDDIAEEFDGLAKDADQRNAARSRSRAAASRR
jgi:hypothetical protein